VEQVLSAEEFALWRRMSAADRRHSIGVARRAEALLTRAVSAGDHEAGPIGSGTSGADGTAGDTDALNLSDATTCVESPVPISRPILAAALLHDVGKVAAGLGTYNRVVATVCGAVTHGEMAAAWMQTSGYSRRIGLYLRHAPIGADMLQMAGSDPLTVTWAREHHLPPDQWTLEPSVSSALKAADDD
jgi:hypothetical protein